MTMNASRSNGMTLVLAVELEGDTEAAASPSPETPELLAGYLAEIGEDRLLTHRQELTLSEKVHSGDQKAKRKLIEKILRLVVRVAKRYRGYGLHFEIYCEER